jgi:hypothetical protein
MPTRAQSRLPKYRHYKPRNLGVARINGHDHHLGADNSTASWGKYNRLIVSWTTNVDVPPRALEVEPCGLTVAELILIRAAHLGGQYQSC